MTLINYLNRVHFADNILEEALWAELDQRAGRNVFVLSDPGHLGGDLAERFRAGLPLPKRVHAFSDPVDFPTEARARDLAARYRALGCELIVAFGPGAVINLTKVVRLLVSQSRPLCELAETEGGGLRIPQAMPDMIAVPTLRGFASGLCGHASVRLEDGQSIDLASPALIPTVTICDPTLIAATPPHIQASAACAAIARCIEALWSPNYNPPADGIALDGLTRALRGLGRAVGTFDAEARRDLMAASLNAALVQQKGLGLIHAIGCALEAVTPGPLDRGAVARLLLPETLRCYDAAGLAQPKALQDALIPVGGGTAEALRSHLAGLPLPARLSDMGVLPDRLDRAAAIAARHRALNNAPHRPASGEIRAMLGTME